MENSQTNRFFLSKLIMSVLLPFCIIIQYWNVVTLNHGTPSLSMILFEGSPLSIPSSSAKVTPLFYFVNIMCLMFGAQ